MDTALEKVLEDKGRQVHVTSPARSVLEAVSTMIEKKVGALLVLEEGKPVGIFTERDVLNRVVASGRAPSETSVSEVMTTNIVAVCSETTVGQAMAIMTNKRCRHLPIMDGDEVVGLISSGDLTHWVVRTQSSEIDSLIRYITGQYPG